MSGNKSGKRPKLSKEGFWGQLGYFFRPSGKRSDCSDHFPVNSDFLPAAAPILKP